MGQKESDILNEFLEKTNPNHGKLVKDKKGTYRAVILDAEMDAVKCKFHNDNGVQLNTKGLSYIDLSIDNLYQLIGLVEKAERKYEKDYKEAKKLGLLIKG